MLNYSVTLQTFLAQESPVVNIGRVQIEQVLINLIMNACDAMESLDATERAIILRTTLGEDKSMSISVIDQGVGEGALTDRSGAAGESGWQG